MPLSGWGLGKDIQWVGLAVRATSARIREKQSGSGGRGWWAVRPLAARTTSKAVAAHQ